MRNNINVQYYENEYEELIKFRNTLLHFHKVSELAFQTMYDSAYLSLKKDAPLHSDSIKEQIFWLQRQNGCRGTGMRFKEEWMNRECSNKRIHKTMLGPIYDAFHACAVRMASIRLLVDIYEPMDDVAVKTSAAVVTFGQKFRYYAETNIGWRNHINVEAGIPGDLKIKEKIETSYSGNQFVAFEATIGVDHTYMETVVPNNIEVVDIAGKDVAVVWAKEIEEHELKDEGVKLFESIVAYTRVPRSVNTWNLKAGQAKEIVLVEKKHIAVQHIEGGKDIIATGKDQSWAIRTMKGRMKRKMYDLMGL